MHINYKQKGISLIELVIFIVILSVALTGITLIYINTSRHSADPMLRIRSIELAQSTLEEILLKTYDNSTPAGGGCVRFPAGSSRCPAGNPIAASETTADFGDEEGGDRSLFNDVDDYHNKLYCGQNVTATNTACPTLSCQTLTDESANDISTQYPGFSICIKLNFADAEINNVAPGTGSDVLTNDGKRINVTVTDPLNTRMEFYAYRLNF